MNADPVVPGKDAEESFLQAASSTITGVQEQRAKERAQEKAEAEASRQKLLQHLQYDPDILSHDISTCLQLGNQLEQKGKSKAAAMIRHEKFRSFMQQTHSSAYLLVNGRDDVASTDGISPLSFVAAELTRISRSTLGDPNSLFVVNYFCAAHRSSPLNDPAVAFQSSATGMMASLVGQLLSQMIEKGLQVNFSIMNDSRWRKLERLEPKILCKLFGELAKQMPPGCVLLCAIDEVCLYETQLLEFQTALVLEKLVRLVKKMENGPQIFKLLVTCQDRALGISKYFSANTLDLQENVDEDDSAEWAIGSLTY